MQEHCCYITKIFSPSLRYTMNRKGQFEAFSISISNIADAYRAEINKHDLKSMSKAQLWNFLKKNEVVFLLFFSVGIFFYFFLLQEFAQTLFERASRAFRTVLHFNCAKTLNNHLRKVVQENAQKNSNFFKCLSRIHVCPNKYLFMELHEVCILFCIVFFLL